MITKKIRVGMEVLRLKIRGLRFYYKAVIRGGKWFINILYNVISLNILPIKGGVLYFFLLLLGILSYFCIRLDVFNRWDIHISYEQLIIIKCFFNKNY